MDNVTPPPSAPVLETEESYYEDMCYEYMREIKKETFHISSVSSALRRFLPPSGIVDDHISINRYLMNGVSVLMFRMMMEQWNNVVHIPVVEMMIGCFYDLDSRSIIHSHCVNENNPGVTAANIQIKGMTSAALSELIDENKDKFFCSVCDLFIFDTLCKWTPDLILKAIAALGRPLTIFEVYHDDKDVFRIDGESNAICYSTCAGPAPKKVCRVQPRPRACRRLDF